MINWILQSNLTKPKVIEAIKLALTNSDETFQEITMVPFSYDPPEVKYPNAFNIVYGSSTLMLNAYKDKNLKRGLFYDPLKFSMSNYVNQWKTNLLNHDGQLIELGEIKNLNSKANQKWFIRPNDDEKGFSGALIEFEKLNKWIADIAEYKLPDINPKSKAWISTPKNIKKEWRLFVVDDKIISSSRYMKNGELNIDSTDNPTPMINFTLDRIKEYRLNDVYVMDIAETENEYKIIECNCFNGTGFYDHDIGEIVSAINRFVRKQCR